jgi:hypothetical protein
MSKSRILNFPNACMTGTYGRRWQLAVPCLHFTFYIVGAIGRHVRLNENIKNDATKFKIECLATDNRSPILDSPVYTLHIVLQQP